MSRHPAEPIRQFLLETQASAAWAARQLGTRERQICRIKGGEARDVIERTWQGFLDLVRRIEAGDLEVLTAAAAQAEEKRRRTQLTRSGLTGITWCPRLQRWRALCKGRGLGYWLTREDAIAAREHYLATGEIKTRFPQISEAARKSWGRRNRAILPSGARFPR